MGVDLVCAGAPRRRRARSFVADERDATASCIVDAEGRTVGAILLGDTRGAELLMDAVRTGREASDPLALLAEA